MDIFTEKEMESSGGEMNETETKKLCANCKTTKTPLWRSGPAGPKSLCNACGIRFRKKKGDPVLGVNKGLSDRKKDKPSPSSSSSSSPTSVADVTANSSGENGNYEKTIVDQGKDGNMGGKLRVRLMGFGKEVVLLQRRRSPMKRRRSIKKKIGEVEQAAVLLMALSYTSVYA